MSRQPRLRDLGRWFSGGTPPRDDESAWAGDVPWLSAKDIDRDVLRPPTAFITEAAAVRWSRIAPPGSILMIVRGMALAHGLPAVLTGQRAAFNQDLRALVPDASHDPRFIQFALRGNRLRLGAHIDKAAHGTARIVDSIYRERLWAPDRAAQRAIADFLDRECERIVALSQTLAIQRARLAELRSATTREAIVGLRHAPLKYAASVVDCKHRTAEYVDVGLPIISTREVKRGALVVDEATRRVAAADFVDLREAGRDPRRGDIIYSRNASVGVAAYLSEDIDVCMGQDVVLITRRPNDSELLSHVLNWAVADQVASLSIGSTFSRINVATIRELVVPDDDPVKESAALRAMRAEYSHLDALESVLTTAIERLGDYRDALVTEAVTGQLDVPALSDAEMDESAHAVSEGAVVAGQGPVQIG